MSMLWKMVMDLSALTAAEAGLLNASAVKAAAAVRAKSFLSFFPFPNTFSYEVYPLARFAPVGSRLGFNVRSQWQLRVAIWYRVRSMV